VSELLAALQAELAALPAQLPAPLGSMEESSGVGISASERIALIEQARAARQRGELDEAALQRLSAAQPAQQARALEDAINDFDFERADALLAELLGQGDPQP